ncbi:MAG: pyridoxal phosphate-dependent aminotransferase [Candidatus Thorarchaeota archaeon]
MDLGYCKRLSALTSPARENPDTIELSMCDPPRFGFGPDPDLTASMNIESPEQGYPSVNEELIQGIKQRTRSFTGVSVDDSEVVITNGCGGAFGVLSIALRGWTVGIETPFYLPAYEYFRRTTDIWYARCRPELDWALDLDLLRKELAGRNNPGALFLVSPSNPTGHIHSESDLRKIVDLAGEFDQILITDEVYDEMSFSPFASLLKVSKDIPVIYMHGFSKVWRAPEIRVGFLILHDPSNSVDELFSEIQQVAALGFGVNPLSQMLALRLLEENESYRKAQFDSIRARRNVLQKAIMESTNLKSVEARGATYQIVKTPWNDWETCTRLVMNHNILVTPASVHDPYIGDRYIRVVFLSSPEHLSRFVQVLDTELY